MDEIKVMKDGVKVEFLRAREVSSRIKRERTWTNGEDGIKITVEARRSFP